MVDRLDGGLTELAGRIRGGGDDGWREVAKRLADDGTRTCFGEVDRDALAELVGRDDEGTGELFRVTGGNPFYALELAAAPPGTVPTSVRDAVLTRVLGLPEPAQQALGALSVVPTRAERGLLEARGGVRGRALDAAERAGVVVADADTDDLLGMTIVGPHATELIGGVAMGRLLDDHQQIAVRATNAYLAKVGKHRPHLDGWLVVRKNGAEEVLFITRRDTTTPYIAAIASHVRKEGARIKILKRPRTLDAGETALWKARTLAFQAKMKPCSKQYQPVVLPVTAAGVKEIFVYLLPLAPAGKIVLGGYYRVRINAQGTRILDTHAYTHACLEVERRPKAIGAGVTELESPTPTAPQVYANLRFNLPIYVKTTGNDLRWKIEQGRITLLSKPAE